MKRCVECGSSCKDEEMFCPVCGAKFASEDNKTADPVLNGMEETTNNVNDEKKCVNGAEGLASDKDTSFHSGDIGRTYIAIPKDDPNHIKDLLEICAKSEYLLLQNEQIKAVFLENNISPETEPRICLAYVNHVLLIRNSFIDRMAKDGEMPIVRAIQYYMANFDEKGNTATEELIVDIQKYVGTSDNIPGNIILAAEIATCADSIKMRSLATMYLDRVVPKGAIGLIDYLKDDQISELLCSALWLCDYLDFRSIYKKSCAEHGAFDSLSRATSYDKTIPDSEIGSFLEKYAESILNDDPEKIFDDTINSEKYINTYQEYESKHIVSNRLRLAFLILGLHYAKELIFASAGLVTAEYFNSEIDKYLDSLSPEDKNNFIDALRDMHPDLSITAMREMVGELIGLENAYRVANWKTIVEHIEALAGIEHQVEESNQDTLTEPVPAKKDKSQPQIGAPKPPVKKRDNDSLVPDEIGDETGLSAYDDDFQTGDINIVKERPLGKRHKNKGIIILFSVFLSVAILTGGYIVIKSITSHPLPTPEYNPTPIQTPIPTLVPTPAPDFSMNVSDNQSQEPIYRVSPTPSINLQSDITNQTQLITGRRSNRNLSELQPVSFSRASATSQIYASALDYYADKAIDGAIKTSWQENVEGQGIGESLTLFFNGDTDISYIGIFAGSFESEEAYYANSRLKKARIDFSQGETMDYDFDDIPTITLIELSRTVRTRYIRITIEDVFPGYEWEDTAIAEVAAFH